MPQFPLLKNQTLLVAGGTATIDVNETVNVYSFNGSGTLAAAWAISPSAAPTKATVVKIFYNCQFALNGHTITIFGKTLNLQQALLGNILIEASYDLITASWIVVVKESDADLIPEVQGVETTTLLAAGGTITLVPGINKQWQELIGSPTLVANYAVTAPSTKGFFYVHYNATAVPGGNAVTIFGLTLTQAQIAAGKVLVFAYFDVPNNVWRAQLISQPSDANYEGVTNTTVVTGGDVTVTLTEGASTQFQRLTGSGNLGGNVVVTNGAFTKPSTFYILYDATATVGAFSVTILGQVLTAYQALYGKVLVIATYDVAGGAFRIQLLQSPNTGLVEDEAFIVPVSFETGEQCRNSFVAPCNGTINLGTSYVTKALAITDPGLVTLKINGTDVTNGQISIAAAATVDTLDTATPSGANTFVKGDVISADGTKATAGGKALVTISYTKTA